MAEFKGTPGPWEVGRGAYSLRPDEWSVWHAEKAAGGEGRVAAWIRREADARLIAAAPDLLAACEEALALIEEFAVEEDEPMQDAGALLRAAIKKAKGGA